MCEHHQPAWRYPSLDRRRFFRIAGSATALGVFNSGLLWDDAYADALTQAQRDKMSPNEIIDVMKQGNERFRSGVRQNRNYLNEQRASASGQYPAAVLLSCIDSRAPAEVIMDLGIGDIFQLSGRGQHRQSGHSREHGICLQIGRCEGGARYGAYGVRRNQRRHRQC
jgi:carbonic anhydrase